VLGAIGLTRAQRLADRVCATAVPVVAGSIGAGLVAYAASGLFPLGFARNVEPHPGLRLEPIAHGLGVAVLGLVLLAWVAVARLLGERSGRALHRIGAADRLADRLQASPVTTGLRFALTRHPRDPGSVRAPLLGLVSILVVLVGSLTFGVSVDRFLHEPARSGSNFDFATGTGEEQVPPEMRATLEQDPDVEGITLYGTILASVGSASLEVTGMQPLRGHIVPEVLSGRLPDSGREIILGRVAARRLHVHVGDRLTVAGPDGPAAFTITGLAVIPGIEGGDGVGEGGVVTQGGYGRLDAHAGFGAAAVSLRPGAHGALERLRKELGQPVGLPDPGPTVRNLSRVRSTPYIVAGALAALAVLSLSHQLLTSTRRRRRDLAVLRAIGCDRRWVGGVVRWQVAVLAASVLALALPLGVAAGRVVYQAYIGRLGARTDVSVPYLLLGAMALGLIVLGQAAALVPARRIHRETSATALQGR
jgi:hypothetical protein